MARMEFTVAKNVRQYTTYSIDLDAATDENLNLVERARAYLDSEGGIIVNDGESEDLLSLIESLGATVRQDEDAPDEPDAVILY